MSISTEPTSRTARTEAELQAMAARPPLDALLPPVGDDRGPGRPDHRQGRGPPHLGLRGQASTSTASPACSSSTPVTVAAGSPRRARARPSSSRSSRSGRTRTRPRSSSPTASPTYAPGDLNHVFFSTGGGEAVETAFKLAKHYWKLAGQPTKHKVISRYIAYHGTPQGALAITGLPGMKSMFEPVVPGGFRVPNTNFYRAGEMGFAGGTRGGVRRLGGRPHRGDDQLRGTRHRRRRLPRAGAELGWLLPATPRLLPARARDLRQVRRAARLGRGHLRVRATRPLLRAQTHTATSPT